MKTLYIIRGPQGAGKSTLAHKLADEVYEADQYFIDPVTQEYDWKKSEISDAHNYCLTSTTVAMSEGVESIAVANTFASLQHILPYQRVADKLGYKVVILEAQNNFGNVHEVKEEVVGNVRRGMQPMRMPSLEESAEYNNCLKNASQHASDLFHALRAGDQPAATEKLIKLSIEQGKLDVGWNNDVHVTHLQEIYAIRVTEFVRLFGAQSLRPVQTAVKEAKLVH